MSEQIKYRVSGMHCGSCELLIEQKIKELPGVERVVAVLAEETVMIFYKGEAPSLAWLNSTFTKHGYTFSEDDGTSGNSTSGSYTVPLIIAVILAGAFLYMNKISGGALRVDSESGLGAFFVFGLLAGVSSCAALVGGLVLSLADKWSNKGSGIANVVYPHALFNVGRLVSYMLAGLLLGLLGAKAQLSTSAISVLVIVISAVMAVFALQMLGVSWAKKIRLLPKSVARAGAKERGATRWSGFITGFLTVLVPCGFTLIVESVAILSKNPITGMLVMGLFSLGTSVGLLAVGIVSSKLAANKKLSQLFNYAAAFLVLFFVAYNVNVQFSITARVQSWLNRGKINTFVTPVATSTAVPTAVVTRGAGTPAPSISPTDAAGAVQLIKTEYTSALDINPNKFEVKVGRPVRMEVLVKDDGSGCMSTIRIDQLYPQSQLLRRGETLVMEFTPTAVGEYQITCAMGVPRGIIKVVE